jgi:D-amino-acid dehydrogenase
MRVVVIGAGVLGASVAYHASLMGADVVVVDRNHDGRATAAGAGIVCPWASGVEDPVFYGLYASAARYYGELIPSLAPFGDTGYRRSGALCVSDDRRDLDHIEHLLGQRAADDPAAGLITRLSPDAARALFPPLRTGLGAVQIGGGARVDGRRLAAALLAGAQVHGATVHRAKAQILALGDRSNIVQAGRTTIEADAIVVAAGAWAPTLLRPFGIELAIEPQRGQITHLRLPNQDTSAWPVILPPGSHYLLAFEQSRIVAGATRETGTGFDYRVTAAGQAEVLREALAVAPGLASATVIETRIGFRPVGPELRPLLGLARGCAGLAIGNGLGASGLTMGPFAGKLLAETVLGRRTEIDLAPFDPMRHVAIERTGLDALR